MRCIARLAALLLTAALLSLAMAPLARAQESRWQPAVRVYETQGRIVSLLLLADRAGRLHLLWGEEPAPGDASAAGAAGAPAAAPVQPSALYTMVQSGDGWSAPLDILVEPAGSLAGLRGAVDAAGMIHIVYGLDGPLRYARSLAPTITSARDWSAPITLATGQQTGGSITVDSAGLLRVTYGAVDQPVQWLTSADGGASWVGPAALTSAPLLGQATLGPQVAYGPTGTGHLAWNEGAPGDPAQDAAARSGGFHASSADGVAWSSPLAVTALQMRIVALAADPAGAVHVLVSGVDGVGGRYHRWSPDGGANWSEPRELVQPAISAEYSGGDMAVDGAGSLHATFTAVDGKMAAHAERARGQWSPWRNLAPNPPPDAGLLADVAVEVTLGNRLHAAWRREDGQIWVAQGVSNAPAQAPVELATPAAPPAVDSAPAPEVTAAATVDIPPTPASQGAPAGGASARVPARILLLLTALPTLLLLGAIFLWQVRRRG